MYCIVFARTAALVSPCDLKPAPASTPLFAALAAGHSTSIGRVVHVPVAPASRLKFTSVPVPTGHVDARRFVIHLHPDPYLHGLPPSLAGMKQLRRLPVSAQGDGPTSPSQPLNLTPTDHHTLPVCRLECSQQRNANLRKCNSSQAACWRPRSVPFNRKGMGAQTTEVFAPVHRFWASPPLSPQGCCRSVNHLQHHRRPDDTPNQYANSKNQ